MPKADAAQNCVGGGCRWRWRRLRRPGHARETAMHRTILAVDVEGFSSPRRTNADRLAIRAGLYDAVQRALVASGVGWGDCHHADLGDGILVLAPAGYPKAIFAERVPPALAAALTDHNGHSPAARRIRLRLALHAGEVSHDAHGATGQAILHAFRLLDSPAVKQALARSAGCLALIASAWFYDEVIRHSALSGPERYARVFVHVKETSAQAWIREDVSRPVFPGGAGFDVISLG
ncbi:hypothetical protein [Amycolatopsis sp. CA-128772]|uniref:hypothetical protein n=1 Tax=Amycolatopsis sp. CA-128772 TaxID=2073159 RepID=UPI0011AFF930|nr:hypothetical protein [Amycolatopsis sp. CA-128772]